MLEASRGPLLEPIGFLGVRGGGEINPAFKVHFYKKKYIFFIKIRRRLSRRTFPKRPFFFRGTKYLEPFLRFYTCYESKFFNKRLIELLSLAEREVPRPRGGGGRTEEGAL